MISERLLVTRFSPHAETLANKLNEVGCFAIAQPLLTVEPLSDLAALNRFISADYDLVIVVSGNAVKYTNQQVAGHWPNVQYLAVGKSTKKALQKVTQQVVLSPLHRFDSEGLLDLDVLDDVRGKKILILRGEGGRDLLEKALSKRGAKVDFFQTYKRINIALNGQKLVNNWQQALINGAIISSIEILNRLFILVPIKHKNWLSDLIFYVPSQRVADQALYLGAKKVVLLPSLHTEKIIDFFKK